MQAILEHANISVSDPDATAAWLCAVFGWQVRWRGVTQQPGYSVHVGTNEGYIALLAYDDQERRDWRRYHTVGALNHVGIFVDDIDEAESRVIAAGFAPDNHQDYAPGRRFYFRDHDGLEWEVASHQP